MYTKKQMDQRQIDRNTDIYNRMRRAQNKVDILTTHSFNSVKYRLIQPDDLAPTLTIDRKDDIMNRQPEPKQKPRKKKYPVVPMYKRPDTLPPPAEPGTQHPTQGLYNQLRGLRAQMKNALDTACTRDLGKERLKWDEQRARWKPRHLRG